jgi:hypothetical protein
MAKTMYWFNDTGDPAPIGASSGGSYLYWFQDAGHEDPCPSAAGLPGSGDTVYGGSDEDSGGIDISGICSWVGVHIAGGTFHVVNGTLNLSTETVIEAGVVLVGESSASLICGAKFNGNVVLNTGSTSWGQIMLTTGWQVNGGQAGGSLTVVADGGITVMAPGGVPTYNNVTLATTSGDIDLGGMGTFGLTGTFVHLCGGFYTPPTGIDLLKNGASADGVTAAVPSSASGAGGMVVV